MGKATLCSIKVKIVDSCMFGKFCFLSVQVLFSAAISKAHIEIKTAVVEGACRNEATWKILRAVLNGLENKLIPPPEVLGIADGSWLEGAGEGKTAE